MVEAMAPGTLIPIVCVSAKPGVGLPEFLDALANCALPPDTMPRKAKTPKERKSRSRPTPPRH